MITSKTRCVATKKPHDWGNWNPYLKDHDQYLAEPPYVYRRDCQTLGCEAFQLAEGLKPVGKVREVDRPVTLNYESPGKP